MHLKEFLIPRYLEELTKEIQAAYLESYADYGQELFDRYVAFADFWIQKRSTSTLPPVSPSTSPR